MRGQGREGVRAISSTQDQRPSRLPPLSAPSRVRPKAPQVWTYLKGRAGREEGSEKFLSHLLKCGRHGSQAESRSAGNPDCALGTQREFSRPQPEQGDCDSDWLSSSLRAGLWARGVPLGTSKCRDPRSRRLLTYWIGGLLPPPPRGRDASRERISKRSRRLGPASRQADTSLSVTYTPSEKRGAGNTGCRLLSCFQPPPAPPAPPPPAGAQDRPLTSLLPAGSAGVSGTLRPALAWASPLGRLITPPPSYSIPSRL